MNQAALAPENPDYLDLVRSVEGVARAHAAASEEGRTLAPEVVRALRASGLFALAAPRPLGGDELDPLAQVEAFEAMARADTSAGWCLMISSLCAAMAGAYLPDRGAAKVFERGVPTCAGLIQPAGVARRVPGGFVVDGRWGFGSGVRHADWIVTSAVVNGPIDDKTGLPEMITIVVPRADVTIEDTWRTAGLKGSGSEHYRVEALSVPEDFTFSFPFGAARRGGPLYRFPLLALLTSGHVGFALGAARGALDAVIELAPSRINTWTRLSMASHAGFHKDLGRAETRLAAARAFAMDSLGRAWDRVRGGGELDVALGASIRLATSYVTDVAAEVATFAFRSGGASALYDASPLQRGFRDLHAATQHIAASEDAYEYRGRVALGLAEMHPLLAPRARA